MFPESLNAVITRRPQADVVISGCEIATVAALLRNDAFFLTPDTVRGVALIPLGHLESDPHV
jgi:hypothetical protein